MAKNYSFGENGKKHQFRIKNLKKIGHFYGIYFITIIYGQISILTIIVICPNF